MSDESATVDPQADPSLSTSTEGTTEAVRDESTSVQPQDGGNADGELETSNVPPELEETKKNLLRDYHAKTQALKDTQLRFEHDLEKYRNSDETLNKLVSQPWFKEAMQREQQKRTGGVDDINLTPEEFETAKADPKAFLRLVSGLADRIVQSRVNPLAEGQRETQENLALQREFETAKETHKDFQELYESDSLDEYLDRGYDFKAAYAMYKLEHPQTKDDLDRKASEKAREMLDEARAGAISRGGLPKTTGTRVLKAKNFDEAFDKGLDAMKNGVRDFVFEK